MKLSGIFDFIESRKRSELYTSIMASNLLTACRVIAIVIEKEEDSAEFVESHLSEILSRYRRLRPDLSERTLRDYRWRAKKALADYLGHPVPARGRRVPLMQARAKKASVPPPPIQSYLPNDWSGTGGVWWRPPRAVSGRMQSGTPKLPAWVTDNRTAVLREVADVVAQTPQERLRTLRRACESGARLLALNRHPQRVLDWVDPLPRSSTLALARLRAEHSERR
jgi:hypothetical protein